MTTLIALEDGERFADRICEQCGDAEAMNWRREFRRGVYARAIESSNGVKSVSAKRRRFRAVADEWVDHRCPFFAEGSIRSALAVSDDT